MPDSSIQQIEAETQDIDADIRKRQRWMKNLAWIPLAMALINLLLPAPFQLKYFLIALGCFAAWLLAMQLRNVRLTARKRDLQRQLSSLQLAEFAAGQGARFEKTL